MQEISKSNKNPRLDETDSHSGGPAFNIKSKSFIDGIPKLDKRGLDISDL